MLLFGILFFSLIGNDEEVCYVHESPEMNVVASKTKVVTSKFALIV